MSPFAVIKGQCFQILINNCYLFCCCSSITMWLSLLRSACCLLSTYRYMNSHEKINCPQILSASPTTDWGLCYLFLRHQSELHFHISISMFRNCFCKHFSVTFLPWKHVDVSNKTHVKSWAYVTYTDVCVTVTKESSSTLKNQVWFCQSQIFTKGCSMTDVSSLLSMCFKHVKHNTSVDSVTVHMICYFSLLVHCLA